MPGMNCSGVRLFAKECASLGEVLLGGKCHWQVHFNLNRGNWTPIARFPSAALNFCISRCCVIACGFLRKRSVFLSESDR